MPVAAQVRPDSGGFVVRLGRDTIAVERWVISGNRLEAVGVSRTPNTTTRRLVATLAADGSVSAIGTSTGDAPPQPAAVSVTPAIPISGGFYVTWDLALRRARRANADSVTITMLSGTTPRPTVFRRTAANRYTFLNQFDIETVATVDAEGRIVSLDVAGGTTVQRAAGLDIEALARAYAQRDAQGRGLGALSPRESTRASVHGASIQVDYGRPSLRGRELRSLVPLDRVWRTGANNATELRTDRALVFGSLTVPPGTYSLFTLPRAAGWQLIINRQTGQSGLDHDPSQDLGRVDMRTRTDAPHSEQFTIEVSQDGPRGVLVLKWGRTEARAAFTVQSSETGPHH
jgi:hypothetical protein